MAKAAAHLVTAETASLWRLLSWRKSIFMRPTPKQYTLRSRSSRRPAETRQPYHTAWLLPELSRKIDSPGKQVRQNTGFFCYIELEGSTLKCIVQLCMEARRETAWALRREAWGNTAGLAGAGCRTLGDDAGAALPQGPVAGQERLRQGLRRLVPDVVVCGRAPCQDVLHALPGVHQLLPHLQVPNLVIYGKGTCCLPPRCLQAFRARAHVTKSIRECELPHQNPGVHQLLPNLRSTCLPLTACKPLGPWLTSNFVMELELPDEIPGTGLVDLSEACETCK